VSPMTGSGKHRDDSGIRRFFGHRLPQDREVPSAQSLFLQTCCHCPFEVQSNPAESCCLQCQSPRFIIECAEPRQPCNFSGVLTQRDVCTHSRIVGVKAIFQQLASCRIIRSLRVNLSAKQAALNREGIWCRLSRAVSATIAGIHRILTQQSLDCNKPPLG
jgi:hypothetical protein